MIGNFGIGRYGVNTLCTGGPATSWGSQIHPGLSLAYFAFEDDDGFGILQSGMHWAWFTAKCSTLTARFRYTSVTVFDTFPWPQFSTSEGRAPRVPNSQPDAQQDSPVEKRSGTRGTRPSDFVEKIRAVAGAARALRALRREIMAANSWSLRDLYRTLETPGSNRLRDAHATLDTAVRAAYGMAEDEDILAFLLKLNLELAEAEARGEPITSPGLPAWVPNPAELVTEDCIQPAAV
jgi:hypothetical protein